MSDKTPPFNLQLALLAAFVGIFLVVVALESSRGGNDSPKAAQSTTAADSIAAILADAPPLTLVRLHDGEIGFVMPQTDDQVMFIRRPAYDIYSGGVLKRELPGMAKYVLEVYPLSDTAMWVAAAKELIEKR